MEWVLQVFDEIDDAIAAWRQWWLRAAPEMELLLVGCWGIAVFGMTHLLGAGPVSLAACATGLSSGAAISVQGALRGTIRVEYPIVPLLCAKPRFYA